jgi:3-dehydroquinate synthase
MSTPTRIGVDLGDRGYDIVIGDGLLADAGDYLAGFAVARVAVVTDETVAGLHLAALRSSLEAAGIEVVEVVLPPGEATKDFSHLEGLLDQLLAARIERRDMLIALGGGVVGDLAGLAASMLRRGVDFIQVPTTLMAQVDSSVGGKTGINSRHGKNLIGAFHQPRLVLADVATLRTLPRREFLAGYAEVVKYGLIGDAAWFGALEADHADLLAGDGDAVTAAVAASCAAKARVVAADEREQGQRALLNLGHSFGHAIELEVGYGADLRHGEAVAVGMVMAFDLSVRLGLCPPEDAARVRRHLAAVGLPVGLRDIQDAPWDAARLAAHMRQDKKVRDGRITFVLARGIGKAFLSREVDPAMVAALLEAAVA